MIRIITISLLTVLIVSCSGQVLEKNYNPKAIELNNKACKMMSRVEYDSALILFDQAIKLDKTYYIPHANKISIYTERKQFDKALDESDKVVKIAPDLAEGWAMGGMLHERQGDVETAMKYYRKSIEIFDERIINPDKAKYIRANRLNRAVSLILLGRDTEGREELRKLKVEAPDSLDNMLIDELLKTSKQEYLRGIFDDESTDEVTQESTSMTEFQGNNLISEAREIATAYAQLQENPSSKELQKKYVDIFPDDADIFKKVFDPPTFDQLYSDSHLYIYKLADLSESYADEVGRKLVTLCVELKKWDADAIGYIQHVTIGYANSHYDNFMGIIKGLKQQDLGILATFLADVENHSAYTEYTDFQKKLETNGEQTVYDVFKKAKEDRIKRNDHGF
jgi:tetratricopeptide (TPR) repeat protein